ncbi:MAG: hypothetical protein V3T53_02625 [Phycisphaerales bacterium]
MFERVSSFARAWMTPVVVASVMFATAQTSLGQCEIDKLSAAEGLAFDEFGTAVAISGDVLVVGAPEHDENGSGSGAVYVYRFDVNGLGTWAQEVKLLPSDVQTGDRFGRSVAVDGNVIVIGAYRDDDNGNNAGATYVFRYEGSMWREEAKLLASDGAPGDYFGYSVAIHGSVAVAGAYRDSDNGAVSGSAYVFRFDDDSGGWLQEAKLLASDGTAYDVFGRAVAVSADRILIGAPEYPNVGPAAGSAYVFRCDEDCRLWVEEAKLVPADISPFDEFGLAVGIRDGLAIIGAPGHSDYGFRSGAAFVFRRVGDDQVWVQEAELLASDGGGYQWFGRSVGIDGEVAIVGARNNLDPENDTGAAYFFNLDSNTNEWIEHAKILPSDGADGDRFGFAVGISEDNAVVGAFKHDDPETNIGAAYVYAALLSLDDDGNGIPDACEVPLGDLNSDGVVGTADLIILLAFWGPCPPPPLECLGDLNADEVVGAADLLILLANWS